MPQLLDAMMTMPKMKYRMFMPMSQVAEKDGHLEVRAGRGGAGVRILSGRVTRAGTPYA
jgi:hypothetical protein